MITGGPGSGKTTLVNALGKHGYATVPEAAIEVIRDLIARFGNDGQKAWRQDHGQEFQEMILEMQIRHELSLGEELGLVFLDRGRHDGLAYCRFRGDEPPHGLLDSLEDWPYDHVFLLETLENFERREHTGRTSTRAESIEIAKVIDRTYRDYGMEPVFVPELSVEERAAFVLEVLGEPLGAERLNRSD